MPKKKSSAQGLFNLLSLLILPVVMLLGGNSLAYSQNIEIDTSSPFLPQDYSKKISMDFKSASLEDVLKILSQQTGLNFISAEGIANHKVTVYLDHVSVDEALEQLLRANNLTYEVQPQGNIYIVKPLPQPGVELITRVYTLRHATVKSAQIENTIKIDDVDKKDEGGLSETIKSLLTSQGKIIEDPRTNSLIVSDIASNFPKIENAISKLDVPVPQILIEVEMLEVTKGTSDLIGNKIANTILDVNSAKKQTFFPFPDQALDPGTRYTAGVINFSGLHATIQFLRTQTGTKTLARPRIMTLNNQAAEIKISTNEAIGSTAITNSSQSNSTSTTGAERVQTGVFLTVTPQANLLTGEITMAVIPKVIVARAGGTFGGVTFRDPEERGTKALLRVQSGDTIIIGGLMRQDITKTVTKMPLLGDIPLIGAIFRHRDETVTDKELIVFLTPHIINETPVPQINATSSRKLDREQEIPDTITKDMTTEQPGKTPAPKIR